MRVVLIYPFPDLDRRQIKINGKIPPLGHLYISGYLRKHGHEPIILDANVEEYTAEETASAAAALKPDVVGISTNTANYSLIREMTGFLRKKTDAAIVIGGHHPTDLPHAALKTGLFDFVVVGEGELSFTSLVNHLNDREALHKIPGIGFMDGSKAIVNEPELIEDLDILEPKAWDLVDMKRYCPSPASFIKRPAISTILSRGCPKNCIYCSVNSIFQGVTRMHSLADIEAELTMLHKAGIRDINFWDSVLTHDNDWARKVCAITEDLGLLWNCNTRVDAVNEDLLHVMAKSGCYEIGYGVEVGSESSLKLLNKDTNIDRVLDSIRLTRKAGIMVKCYFMIGFPWEKEEDIEQTLSFARKINPDFATFSICNPYPGCHLFENVRETFEEDDFSDMNHLSGKYSVSGHFTSHQLGEMVGRAYRDYYLRPGYVWNTVKRIRSLDDLMHSFKAVRDIFF